MPSPSGLTLTSANYHEAVSILKKRFGNKQQIIAKHMDVLLNVEPVTSSHNLTGLRRLYDLIESHIRSLKSLGVAPESYGSLLSSVLLSKLPTDLRLMTSRKVSDEEWSLDALLKVFEEEVSVRERTAMNSGQQQQLRKRFDRGPHTAATLVSNIKHTRPLCCYCQQGHPANDCKVVTRVEDRRQKLRNFGRCFNCLKKGHIGRECRASAGCSRCRGRHHTSLCSKRNNEADSGLSPGGTTEGPSGAKASTEGGPRLNPDAPTFPAPGTTSLWVNTKRAVLLQTARTEVFNPAMPQSSLEVRIVLDSGSQSEEQTFPDTRRQPAFVHCHVWVQ